MGTLSGKEVSLTTVVPFGDAEALRLLYKSDWQGTGLAFLMPYPAEVRKRAELSKTGVYVCTGFDAENNPQVYVGQGIIKERMSDHLLKGKMAEWWSKTVAFVDGADRLDTAHWLYIEDRLIARARNASRYTCHNKQGGDENKPKPLTEAKRIEADHFLEQVLFCLPLLGVEWLSGEATETPLKDGHGLTLKSKGLTAHGIRLADASFVVFKDSMAVGELQPTCPSYVEPLRAELLELGVLKPEGSNYRFTSDYTFNSASRAACTVVGGSKNGLATWKDSEGRTLGDLLAETGKA